MRICFVYQADYPWDIRVEKIALALTRANHDVFLVSANTTRRVREEALVEAKVRRLPRLSPRLGPLNDVVNFPAFFNPFWRHAIDRCVREENVDVILVRDLPLALTAVAVGRRHQIPVVMDMAECYPELLRSVWKFSPPQRLRRFTHNPRFSDWVEQRVVRAVDHTFVMVEESEARWRALGAEPDRVSIVSNTPPLEKFGTHGGIRPHHGEALHLLYAGWVNRTRGVDTVVDGVEWFVRQHGMAIRVTVIGDGDALASCREQVRRHGLQDVVQLLGWQDHHVVVDYAAQANVGLVPHHVTSHSNTTVPNKLFDFMASGIPVLASDTRPVSRILAETGAGLVYRDWDAESFSDALAVLADPTRRQAMGERGQRAVREHFSWERDSTRLVEDVVRTVDRYRQDRAHRR